MYLGDYTEDYADLNFKFTTRDTDAAPFTLAGSPVISVYKGNATGTDKTSAESSITRTIDFHGKTGHNPVALDPDGGIETGVSRTVHDHPVRDQKVQHSQ